jgi:hypothetical protein
LEDADCDHILALDEAGTNSLENFQLLCRTPCHQEKSNDEQFRASYDTLESRSCPQVYKAYVSLGVPKPPPAGSQGVTHVGLHQVPQKRLVRMRGAAASVFPIGFD